MLLSNLTNKSEEDAQIKRGLWKADKIVLLLDLSLLYHLKTFQIFKIKTIAPYL